MFAGVMTIKRCSCGQKRRKSDKCVVFRASKNAALFPKRLALFPRVDVCETVAMSTNVPATRSVSAPILGSGTAALSTEFNVDKLRRIQQGRALVGLSGIPQLGDTDYTKDGSFARLSPEISKVNSGNERKPI